MNFERERLPALDGLRGIAILLVLVHHLIPFHHAQSYAGQIFNGVAGMGWIGVDLFFVLSGFLITGILINSRSSKNYFLNFYARRTLRIFPLYYMIVGASVFIGPWLFPGLETKPSLSSNWWWFYLSNVPAALHPDARLGWLGVFWSLAIEEHFYLVWPAVVYLFSNAALTRICVGVIAVAWCCRLVCNVTGYYHAGYALTPCRMDALALGAVVAVGVRSSRCQHFARPALFSAAILGIIGAIILAWRHSVVWDKVTQLVAMPLIDGLCAMSIFATSISKSGGLSILRSRSLRLLNNPARLRATVTAESAMSY